VNATVTATILYIDEDSSSRTLVERTLGAVGYRVLLADRGLAGIDLAQRETPDLIIVNFALPDLTGREIASMLRTDPRLADKPIIALSAENTLEQRAAALENGMSGCLGKPLDVERLPAQIAFFLSGGRDRLDDDQPPEPTKQTITATLEARIHDLEAANADMRRLDALKDAFIHLTAHELRTPLTLVNGYYSLLNDSSELRIAAQQNAMLYDYIQGLSTAIARMQAVINEILTISRIITNQIDLALGPVTMSDVVIHALSLYAQAFQERRLKILFQKNEWAERIQADPDMLRLVMSNLISNAIKFTPDGGTVTLRLQRQQDSILISVRDTGIGIDRANREAIFERFSSVRAPEFHTTSKTAFMGGGLGLGLAICKGIVEAHGGQIWVESPGFNPDTLPGSEFLVLLPRDAGKSGQSS
jgi:signal transduction histidine kinase